MGGGEIALVGPKLVPVVQRGVLVTHAEDLCASRGLGEDAGGGDAGHCGVGAWEESVGYIVPWSKEGTVHDQMGQDEVRMLGGEVVECTFEDESSALAESEGVHLGRGDFSHAVAGVEEGGTHPLALPDSNNGTLFIFHLNFTP